VGVNRRSLVWGMQLRNILICAGGRKNKRLGTASARGAWIGNTLACPHKGKQKAITGGLKKYQQSSVVRGKTTHASRAGESAKNRSVCRKSTASQDTSAYAYEWQRGGLM